MENGRPRFSDPHTPGAAYVRAAVRAWASLLLPAGLTLTLAPQTALSLFFPAHYQVAAPALRVAAVGSVLLALATLLNGVAQAAGNRRRPAVAAGLAVIAQVATLVWLVPGRGALGAALSLLAAGCVALIGLLPAFLPLLRPLFDSLRASPMPVLLQSSAPLLALTAPLLLLADSGRGTAAFKLGLAGLAYLVILAGSRLSGSALHRPATDSEQRTHSFVRLIDVLIGG